MILNMFGVDIKITPKPLLFFTRLIGLNYKEITMELLLVTMISIKAN